MTSSTIEATASETPSDALDMIYKAYSMDVAIDCLSQMIRHVDKDQPDPELQGKRAGIVALCRKFLESEHSKALVEAYKELRSYLKTKGLLPPDEP